MSYNYLGLQALLATPVNALKIFLIQEDDRLDVKLKDLFTNEIGVSFDILELGDRRSALSEVANYTISQMYGGLSSMGDITTNLTLTIRQLATVSAYPDAAFLLQNISSIYQQRNLNMSEIFSNQNATLGSVMGTFSNKSVERITLILTDYIGNASIAEVVISQPISNIFLALIPDIFSMSFSDIVTYVSLNTDADQSVFVPFNILKHKCTSFNFTVDLSFDLMKKSCFNNSKFLKIVNYKNINRLNIRNLQEMKGNRISEVMSSNYFSLLNFVNMVFEDLRVEASKPLIVKASEVGISTNSLNSSSIIKTTLLIFRKRHLVTASIVYKLFDFPSRATAMAEDSLETIRQNNSLDNIQQLYSSSLYTIFELLSSESSNVVHNDLPKFVNMMSRMEFSYLAKIYNIHLPFPMSNIIGIALQLFGVNNVKVKEIFRIDDADINVLQRISLGDILRFGALSEMKLGDLAENSPVSLISFILGFSTDKMKYLLLSRPVDIATSLGVHLDTLGAVKSFIGNNTFGVSSLDLEMFIKKYYAASNPHVSGSEVLYGYLNTNLSTLSHKFGVFMGNSSWMEIVRFAQKGKFYPLILIFLQ